MDILFGYCDQVVKGEIPACKYLVKAVEKFLREFKDPDFPFTFEEAEAEAYCKMIPAVFRHSKGKWAGNPVELSPWQVFMVAQMFGWKRKDGTRRFRRVFCLVGRKNGKSTIAAIIEIILAHLDSEAGSEVYVAATTLDQAKLVHDESERMVRASPFLMQAATIHKNNIMFQATNSFARPLGSDKSFDGTNSHGVILDELHAWQEYHRPFLDTMLSGAGSRTQPMIFMITTAGNEKSLIFHEELEYCRRILDGTVEDNRQLAIIFEMDNDIDWLADDFDFSLMTQANPNMGISVHEDYLRDQLNEARNKPAAMYRFKTKHANQCASSVESTITAEVWDRIKGPLSDWKTADGISAGIDIGGRDDICSFSLCAKFLLDDQGEEPIYRYETKSFNFIAADTKRDLTIEPWRQWVYEEQIEVCEYVIHTLKERLIEQILELGIQYIGYDAWNCQQLADELELEIGVIPVRCPQNATNMNEPVLAYLEEVSEDRFRPDERDDVLRFAALNMNLERNPQGLVRPSKKHSTEKIDPIVSYLMARKAVNLAMPPITGSLVL
jgi:phage terminase large subunit-like protein